VAAVVAVVVAICGAVPAVMTAWQAIFPSAAVRTSELASRKAEATYNLLRERVLLQDKRLERIEAQLDEIQMLFTRRITERLDKSAAGMAALPEDIGEYVQQQVPVNADD
jgi:hypothetical protein